ncbi:MAG: hypothetical protein J6T51_02590, partial [Kiritimatiellae bacterium]|nr:hypothetical protein [Kiritimatiellia bacterium]
MKNTMLKKKMPLVAAITGGTRSVASAIGRFALVATAICAATGNALATENIINYNTPGGTLNYDEGTTINKPGVHQRILVQSGTVNINTGAYVKAGGDATGECNYVGVDNSGPAYLNINGGTVWCATDGGGAGCLGIGINNCAQPATVTLNSGLLRVDTQVRSATWWNSCNGTTSSGALVVNGGEAYVGQFVIGANTASTGTSELTLNGGSLTVEELLFLQYNGQVFTWGNGTLVAARDNIFVVNAYTSQNNMTRRMEITGTPATFNIGGFSQALPAFTGTGGLTVTGTGGSIAVSGSQSFTGDLTLSNDTALVMTESASFAGRVVLGGANSKLRFDSAKFQGQTVTFSAAGYSVPSGSILDYVELTDPFNFTVSLSGNTITVAPVSVASAAVDYFVEWVQPSSANLYVDTGVRGKTGVKAELQFLYSRPGNERWPVMLGSWGSKRFNLVMNDYDESRWEYGESMSNLGGLAYEGALCTADVEVSAAGLMSSTWTNSQGTRITPTKDAVSGQGVIDTGLNLYLFASNKNGPSQCGKSRLYYCRLREGDTGSWTLVRNLRPCVKDGVAGLYDYVTGNVLYPASSVAGCVLVAGPVAYDRIATWNGGATPTAAELGTAANWTCTDKSGASLQSAVPDRTTLAVFPSGIGAVTLPDGYTAPWGAVRAEGSVAHPATQYGTYTQGRVNVVVPAYDYTVAGEGKFSDLINARSDNSARKLDFGGKQMRHDGWFYVNAAQAGTWAMSIYVDDYYAFYIDDVQVLSYHSWQGGITGAATCEVSEGWHRFTSIIGDTGGGWGTATSFNGVYVPFTFVVNGTTYSLTDDVTFPKGSGTSTITLSADADWSKLGKVALLGGATIDLNGHSLVIDDVLVDDYLGVAITNSAAKKSVIYFLGDPLESKAYADGIIKETDVKIILAKDGDQVATWTGTVSGDPANANNWEDLAGEPVVPTAAYTVKVAGSSVNLQCPAGTDIACKAFEIGNCTFAADCDWRGLSIKPSIIGTANLNGHVLKLSNLSAVSGATFSGGDGSFVEFVVNESATIANLYEHTYIENVGNLAFSGSARIRLRKKDGNGTLTVTRLELGNQLNGDMVQTNGTVNLGNKVNAIGENSG